MSTPATSTAAVTTTYRVEGMTCGHCTRAVDHEISAIPGVCDVDVDLASGRVTVCSDRDLTRVEVSAAVDEAGYQLA